jgi:hypothetical protein
MNKLTESKAAEPFKNELMERILELGLGTYTKNDLYDFILYLANKHSSLKFLDKSSNYENAVAFKVSEAKIKNSKLNIALKFKGEEEKASVLADFLFRIANGRIAVLDKGQGFEFVLDDPFVRMQFENRLKTEEGVTLDYSMNRERVAIEKVALLSFLRRYAKAEEDHFIKELSRQLESQELKRKLKASALPFEGKLKDVAAGVTIQALTGLIRGLVFGAA